MRLFLLPILAATLALLAPPSRAADLLTYPFNGTLDPVTQGGVTGSGFLASGGSKAVVGIGNNSGSYGFILIKKSSTNASDAVSNAQFAQFKITPPKDNGMQLAQVQFLAARGGDSSPRGVVLRWSLDNFKSNLGTTEITTTWPKTKSYSFNVGSFAGTTVTFRLYAYAKETSGAEPSIRFGELVVTGSPIIYAPVVVPTNAEVTTKTSSVKITGTAYSSEGVSRVEVARNSPNSTYTGANGTANWNYTATNLKKGRTTFWFRSVDSTGQRSSPAKVVVRRTAKSNGGKPKPTPTPSNTP
ncbi:MAG TPA: hypothetical protein VIM61_05250 [Chthoniobacterales bacterium]|jgi:hypothetical protein